MADSDTPKRKVSLYPALLALKDYTKTAITAIVAAGSALLTVQRWIDTYATDDEVSAEMLAHNKDEHAHQALVDRIISQAERAQAQSLAIAELEKQRRAEHEALYQMYWLRVGEKAVEVVADPRKRKKAADEARDKFDAFLGRGMPMEDAYRRALGVGVP